MGCKLQSNVSYKRERVCAHTLVHLVVYVHINHLLELSQELRGMRVVCVLRARAFVGVGGCLTPHHMM